MMIMLVKVPNEYNSKMHVEYRKIT